MASVRILLLPTLHFWLSLLYPSPISTPRRPQKIGLDANESAVCNCRRSLTVDASPGGGSGRLRTGQWTKHWRSASLIRLAGVKTNLLSAVADAPWRWKRHLGLEAVVFGPDHGETVIEVLPAPEIIWKPLPGAVLPYNLDAFLVQIFYTADSRFAALCFDDLNDVPRTVRNEAIATFRVVTTHVAKKQAMASQALAVAEQSLEANE